MKINNFEKKLMVMRLNQLKKYLIKCLKTNRLDNYFNTLNSREFKELEEKLINQDYSSLHPLQS